MTPEAHPGDDRLIAYALEELKPTEDRDVAAHLAGCEACARVVSMLKGAMESYRTAARTDLPSGVLVRLLEAQAASRSRGTRPGWRLRPIGALAGFALVGMLFLSGFWTGRRSVPAPELPRAESEARQAIRSPLPDPPRIGFATEPPLEAQFVFAGGIDARDREVPQENDSAQDSL